MSALFLSTKEIFPTDAELEELCLPDLQIIEHQIELEGTYK